VRLVGADLALGQLHPLLHLGQELDDQLRPGRRLVELAAGFTRGDVPRDRVMGTASQLAGVPIRPRELERFQRFHDLACRLDGVPPRGRGHFAPQAHSRRDPNHRRRPGNAVASGRSHDRQRAVLMAANGQNSCPPPGRIPWPLSQGNRRLHPSACAAHLPQAQPEDRDPVPGLRARDAAVPGRSRPRTTPRSRPASTGTSWTAALSTPTSDQPLQDATARSNGRTASTTRSSRVCSTASCSTTIGCSPRSCRSGRTSTTSTGPRRPRRADSYDDSRRRPRPSLSRVDWSHTLVSYSRVTLSLARGR
jgi:hypothetical protein